MPLICVHIFTLRWKPTASRVKQLLRNIACFKENTKTLLFTQSGTKMPNVIFRAIEERDLETLRQWRNMPDIARNMFSSGVITEEQQRVWYESVCRGERGQCWFVESDGQPVGYASLSRSERAEDTYEFGLYVGNQAITNGVGTVLLSFSTLCKKPLRNFMHIR